MWLLRLILDGRAVTPGYDKNFEAFKADKEGKREGYTAADGWLSAKGLKPGERAAYNHSKKYDEARDTLGEIVYGGNGTKGYSIVCFIVEGRKVFVLFNGREDYVLVNKVTMECLAYFASLALPILLAEAADSRERAAGFLFSDKLPRIKDILASKRDEVYNRQGFRGKWKAMTGFFDGYYADVLSEIAENGGTITEAPAALAGQPLVFDYRVLHRGLANPSRERAVAYLVLATDGAYDGQNFCQMSLDDALPAHVEQMCLWSDYE